MGGANLGDRSFRFKNDLALFTGPFLVFSIENNLLGRAGFKGQNSEVFLVREGVAPHRTTVFWKLVFNRIPRELKPFIEPLEDQAAGKALVGDDAHEVGVVDACLLFGVTTLVSTVGPAVGNADA